MVILQDILWSYSDIGQFMHNSFIYYHGYICSPIYQISRNLFCRNYKFVSGHLHNSHCSMGQMRFFSLVPCYFRLYEVIQLCWLLMSFMNVCFYRLDRLDSDAGNPNYSIVIYNLVLIVFSTIYFYPTFQHKQRLMRKHWKTRWLDSTKLCRLMVEQQCTITRRNTRESSASLESKFFPVTQLFTWWFTRGNSSSRTTGSYHFVFANHFLIPLGKVCEYQPLLMTI